MVNDSVGPRNDADAGDFAPANANQSGRTESPGMATEKRSRRVLRRDEIEALIDRRLLETQVTISEKRFNYLLAIGASSLAVFGVVLPIFMTFQSTERADKAIDRMETSFAQLAGKQLRKPDIACLVSGRDLDNSLLTFAPGDNSKTIEIKNIGDGTADLLEVRLYIRRKDDSVLGPASLDHQYWWPAYNDETEYSDAFVATIGASGSRDILPAQALIPISFVVWANWEKKVDTEIPAMLKVFYGEPEPKRIRFGLRLVSDGQTK